LLPKVIHSFCKNKKSRFYNVAFLKLKTYFIVNLCNSCLIFRVLIMGDSETKNKLNKQDVVASTCLVFLIQKRWQRFAAITDSESLQT